MIKNNLNSAIPSISSADSAPTVSRPEILPASSPAGVSGIGSGSDSGKQKGWEAEDAIERTLVAEPLRAFTNNPKFPGLATPDAGARAMSLSLRPELQRQGASSAKKGTQLPAPSYQQRHEAKAKSEMSTNGSSSDASRHILSLREQSLQTSGMDKHAPVPDAERLNHIRHYRSMDGAINGLRKDPTLAMPPRPFPRGVNRVDEKDLPFAQRPGPETRVNSENEKKLQHAMDKHGTKRLRNLTGPERETALAAIMDPKISGKPDRTLDEAEEILDNTPLTGGWEKPRSGRVKEVINSKGEQMQVTPVVVQAKSLASKIIWGEDTKIMTESRGSGSTFAHPLYNPEGNIVTYVESSGRGVRYDSLNVDHVAETVDHDGNRFSNNIGEGLRSFRGFTNPPPHSQRGVEAEARREFQDTIRNVSKDAAREAKRRLKRLDIRDSEKVLRPALDKPKPK